MYFPFAWCKISSYDYKFETKCSFLNLITFHGAIAHSSSGGYGVKFGLCFNGASADKKELYYKTDVAVSDKTSRYYDSTAMEYANELLEEDEDWANNPLWKKGKLHPELVSYEEYLELTK